MVVFQCENCGEAVKKPKADQHARQCRGFKGYVCIDCMKKFTGDSYKQHTSCISEAQKYQGALYVAPKKGNQRKQQQQKPQQAQQQQQQQQQQQKKASEESLKRKHEEEKKEIEAPAKKVEEKKEIEAPAKKVEEKKEVETPAKKEEKKEEEIPAPATKKVKKPKVSDELVSGCKAQIEKVIAKNGGVKPEESALHDVMLALFEKAYAKANK